MNLADAVRNNAWRQPNAAAVVDGDHVYSYRDYDRAVDAMAHGLIAAGAGPGDVIGLNLKDTYEHLIALYAVPRIGAVLLPMDWRWTGSEKSRVADFFGASLVLTEPDDGFMATAGGWRALAPEQATLASDNPLPETEDDPPLVLSLSSGTTGRPKGPLISHGKFFHRFMIYLVTLGFDERTRYLLATPLYFGGSRGYSMCTLYCGGTVILKPPPADPADLVATAAAHRATKMFLVPTQLRRLMELPPGDAPLLDGLDMLFSTGAILHAEERDQLMRTLCPRYLNFYGSTDGGGCSALFWHAPAEKAASVGTPVFGADLEIVGDDGNQVATGDVGEIRYRHPGTADGYWNDPDASAETFRDGWYQPGDLGWIDADGYLFLAGRAKDMIIRAGVNIYPAEIEHVLTLHPAVREAAVVGAPSKERGEDVAAFVVASPGDQPDANALNAWCREHLAPYKVPRDIRVIDDLPKSGVGKVLKADLVDRLGE